MKKSFAYSFFISTFIFILQFNTSQAQCNLQLSESLSFAEQEAGALFVDTNVQVLFAKIYLDAQTSSKPTQFQIEVKKKSRNQSRLKPLYIKRISFKEDGALIDTIPLLQHVTASGNYEVLLSIVDDSMRVTPCAMQAFQLLRGQSQTVANDFIYEVVESNNNISIENTFVAKYDIAQLRKNIAALFPIAEGSDLKVVKTDKDKVELVFLKQFFYNFWLNRDSKNPEQAWKSYSEKLNYVAKKYGSTSMLGYQTDRGRIYLKYGEPEKIERVLTEKNALPYEIWFYYNTRGKGNVKFLFVQAGMMSSEMYLLHSNQEEEVVNPYWQQQLLINSESVDTKLSHKVFEYFK